MKDICKIFLFFIFIVLANFLFSENYGNFKDEGFFYLFVQKEKMGEIEFALDENGNYERKISISMAGQKLELSLSIKGDGMGSWNEMEIKAPTDNIKVENKKPKVIYKSEAQKKSYELEVPENYYLYDNYGPALETFFLKNYDSKTGGKQTFKAFIIPSQVMDFYLTFKKEETKEINGVKENFNVFDFEIAGIQTILWADSKDRIVLMEVPVQYASFVRKGYEELLKKEEVSYDVEVKTVYIPTRDGVKLATDLYFPKGINEKLPVILIRTPYKKEMNELDGKFWAKNGFACAIQDVRGRFSSEGLWEPFVNEGKDGYDTIEWLGLKEWSNGKVGMIGASYLGWVQLWAAVEEPPHLTTIIPQVAPPDPFFNIPYEYGCFFLLGAIWWAEILESQATADLSGKAFQKINERKYEKILKKLPVIDLDKEILGKENKYWRLWIDHNTFDQYWKKFSFQEKLKNIKIPVFIQSGWFDGDGIGSKLNYLSLKESKSPYVKLIIGPWGHSPYSSTRYGDYTFGQEAAKDMQKEYLRWMEKWLKGKDNGIEKEPSVEMFVMFEDKWEKGNSYPLPQTDLKKLYLSSEKDASTSQGDGKLEWEIPKKGKEFDSYIYDPNDPTPSPEFRFLTEEEEKEEEKGTINLEKRREMDKKFHQEIIKIRKDILVYRTEPLENDLIVVGPLSAKIYASSDAPDTDFFVTLNDVDEDGKILQLSHGCIRARYRNSFEKTEKLEKGKVYEFNIDLWHTGILFKKGHRIQVEVSSALFPSFSRNLNTAGNNEKETKMKRAQQKIYHSKDYPSHILLPVLERKI